MYKVNSDVRKVKNMKKKKLMHERFCETRIRKNK